MRVLWGSPRSAKSFFSVEEIRNLRIQIWTASSKNLVKISLHNLRDCLADGSVSRWYVCPNGLARWATLPLGDKSRALKQETYKTHRTGSNLTFLPTLWLLLLASVLEDIIQKVKVVR